MYKLSFMSALGTWQYIVLLSCKYGAYLLYSLHCDSVGTSFIVCKTWHLRLYNSRFYAFGMIYNRVIIKKFI